MSCAGLRAANICLAHLARRWRTWCPRSRRSRGAAAQMCARARPPPDVRARCAGRGGDTATDAAPLAVNHGRRPNDGPRHIEARDQSGRGCDFHGSRSRAAEGRRRRDRSRCRSRSLSRSRSSSRSLRTAMVPERSRGGGGAAVPLLRGSSPARGRRQQQQQRR